MKNTENSEIISKNRRKYYLKIHLILVVKYRKKLINDILKKFIYNEFNNIAKKYNFTIDEINDDKNHIHLLISYDPNIKISSIVMRLKQISTYNLWLNYEDYLKKIFFKERTFWSDGYFVSSIGYINEDKIKKYIKLQ